jgi:mannose-6-phosphate isomerase-like protein (cupin superfamily)
MMKVREKSGIKSSLITPAGEIIYELIGKGDEAGGISSHSIAQIQIPPGKSSVLHYHQKNEESYYILRGEAWMEIDQREFALTPGQVCLIQPGEKHRIRNKGNDDLEFLAFCAPAWVPEDSFEV